MSKQLKLKEWEGRKVVFTAVYGSWNYGTNDSTSDIDYKVFVMPTLDDLYTNNQYSHSGKMEDGNDIEVHDIRKLSSLLSKANPSYLEIIASDYIWANEGFEDYVKFLTDNKYKIGSANMKALYHAAKGIMHEKMGAIKKGYPSQETNEGWKRKQLWGFDCKQYMHQIRMLWMMQKIFTPNVIESRNIMSCFKLDEQEVLELLQIKKNQHVFLSPNTNDISTNIEIVIDNMQENIKNIPVFEEEKYGYINEEINDMIYQKTKAIVLGNIAKMKLSGIYKITNNINGKFYIGLSRKIKVRWMQHKNAINYERNKKLTLYKAFEKYGIENFSFEIIEHCQDENLNEREKWWIEKLKPEYNMTLGGGGFKGYKFTEEDKKKISLAKMGKSMSIKARENMSKGRKGKLPWNAGKKLSKEHIDKLVNSHGKKVQCVETGIIYNNMKSAALKNGIAQTTFKRKLYNGETINGYNWIIIENKEMVLENIIRKE